MRLTVVGCGDAFGSGGRDQACFLVESGGATLALDLGATALVSLKRMGLEPSAIDTIVLSHLHGDHFGGVPFFLLDAQFVARREHPLSIVGPPGTASRVRAAMDVLYPGSWRDDWRFRLEIVDLEPGTPHRAGPFAIITTEVIHPSGAPSTAVRVTDGERLLGYSGDTTWTDALVDVARGCDLMILECYLLRTATPQHLGLATIEANRQRLAAKRILLTHMAAEVLADLDAVRARGYLPAHDGLVLDL